MIGYFPSCVDSAIGLDVSSTVMGSFRSCTITMMSWGFWNYRSTHCFSFSLNFLYSSLDYLCLDVGPKTAPKWSTSPLNFRIDDVYAGWLKRPPCHPQPWWPLISAQITWPSPWNPLLLLYFLVSGSQVVVVSPSPSLIPVDSGTIFISVFMAILF